MIDVTIKTLDGANREFSVPDTMTVKEFKEKIASKINIPAEVQRLIFRGRVLQNEKPLKDYDVQGKVIHVVQGAPPSSSGSSNSATPNPPPPSHHHHHQHRPDSFVVGSFTLPSDILDPNQIQNVVQQTLSGMGDTFRNARVTTRSSGDGSSLDVHINLGQMAGPDQEQEVSQRLTTVEHMLEIATNALNRLENPSAGTQNTESSTGATPMETDDPAPGAPDSRPQAAAPEPSASASAQQSASQSTQQQPSARASLARFADLADQISAAQQRLQPFLQRVTALMREEQPAPSEEQSRMQRTYNLTMETMHALSHASHGLSDLMLDVSASPPRQLSAPIAPSTTVRHMVQHIPVQAVVTGPMPSMDAFAPHPPPGTNTTATTTTTSSSAPTSAASQTNTATPGAAPTSAAPTSTAPGAAPTSTANTSTSTGTSSSANPSAGQPGGPGMMFQVFPGVTISSSISAHLVTATPTTSGNANATSTGTSATASTPGAANTTTTTTTTAGNAGNTTNTTTTSTFTSTSSASSSSSSSSSSSTQTHWHSTGPLPPNFPVDLGNMIGSFLNAQGHRPGHGVHVNVVPMTLSGHVGSMPPQMFPFPGFPGFPPHGHSHATPMPPPSSSTATPMPPPPSSTATPMPPPPSSTATPMPPPPPSSTASTIPTTATPTQPTASPSASSQQQQTSSAPTSTTPPPAATAPPSAPPPAANPPPTSSSSSSNPPGAPPSAASQGSGGATPRGTPRSGGHVDPFLHCSSQFFLSHRPRTRSRPSGNPQVSMAEMVANLMSGLLQGPPSGPPPPPPPRAPTSTAAPSAAPQGGSAPPPGNRAGSGPRPPMNDPLALLATLMGIPPPRSQAQGSQQPGSGAGPTPQPTAAGGQGQGQGSGQGAAAFNDDMVVQLMAMVTGNMMGAPMDAEPTRLIDIIRFLDPNFAEPNQQTGTFNDLLLVMARHLTFPELLQLLSRQPHVLIRCRAPVRDFLQERLLQNQPDSPAAREAAVERLVQEVITDFETREVQAVLHPVEGVDMIATLRAFFRQEFSTLLGVAVDTQTEDAPWAEQLYERTRRMLAMFLQLYQTCSVGGQADLNLLVQTRLGMLLGQTSPHISSWLITMFLGQLQTFVQSMGVTPAEVECYIVRTAPASDSSVNASSTREEVPMETSPVGMATPSPSSSDAQSPSPASAAPAAAALQSRPGPVPQTATAREVRGRPAAASVNGGEASPTPGATALSPSQIGGEGDSWQAAIPAEWVPIIREDIGRQKQQRPQPSLSDAYLQGLPPKRRKVMMSERPTSELSDMAEYVPGAIRQAAAVVGAEPITSLDHLASDIAQDEELLRALDDEASRVISSRLSSDSDYISHRFPRAEEYFHQPPKS